MRAQLLFGVAILALGACTDEDVTPTPVLPDMTPGVVDDELTPEFAGFGDARVIEFAHYTPAAGCVLDVEARAATCDVSGCSVPDIQQRIDDDAALLPWLTCADGPPPASSGINFSTSRVLFVRQGTQVGEWMRPAPVVWVVDDQGTVIVAERHEAFCITGSTLSGGVVPYALILPVSTATQALDRRIYRNPRGCDVCSDEGDCSS